MIVPFGKCWVRWSLRIGDCLVNSIWQFYLSICRLEQGAQSHAFHFRQRPTCQALFSFLSFGAYIFHPPYFFDNSWNSGLTPLSAKEDGERRRLLTVNTGVCAAMLTQTLWQNTLQQPLSPSQVLPFICSPQSAVVPHSLRTNEWNESAAGCLHCQVATASNLTLQYGQQEIGKSWISWHCSK